MRLALNIRPTEALAAVLAAALVFGAHLAYGANSMAAGLALAAAEGGMLILFLALPWVREALARSGSIVPAAWAYALVIAAALWTLTPFGPGGPNPAWSYVNAPAAITIDRLATSVEIVKLLGLAAIFLCGFALGSSDERGRWTLNLVLAAGGAYALYGLIRYASGAEWTGTGRLSVMFGSANSAGALMGVMTVIAMGMAFAAERRQAEGGGFSRFLAGGPYWALTLLFAACLMLTASRGAAIATAGAILAFFALEAWAGRVRVRAMVFTGVAAGLLLLVQGSGLIARLGGAAAGAKERAYLLSEHWKVFQEAPILGYGLGSFDTVNKLHLDRANYAMAWADRAAHNVYVQWFEEAGLVGALPMFACIGLILWGTVRGVGRRRRTTTQIRGLIAANLVLLIHGWSDYALQVPSITAFWSLLLGLQLGLANASTARKD